MTQLIERVKPQDFTLEIDGEICKASELYSATQIKEGVQAMGARLAEEYKDSSPILMVTLLQGAMPYAIALRNAIKEAGGPRIDMDSMRVGSYDGGTESSGTLRFIKDVTANLVGRHVLVADDIFDTGRTLSGVRTRLMEQEPASIRFTTLLDKPSEARLPGIEDHIGDIATVFTMDNPYFVIGYGLDYMGKYRQLDYIAKVRRPLPGGGFEP